MATVTTNNHTVTKKKGRGRIQKRRAAAIVAGTLVFAGGMGYASGAAKLGSLTGVAKGGLAAVGGGVLFKAGITGAKLKERRGQLDRAAAARKRRRIRGKFAS